MPSPGAVIAVGGALLLAVPVAHAEPVRPGEESTFDLGILPQSTPDVLKQARSRPYVAPAGENCASIAAEIARLDEALGPDADAATRKKRGIDAGKFVGQAVRSLIPYRSVVRFVTGADRQAKARNEAAMAGWARRGYLKGVQANLGCPGATAAPTTTAGAGPAPDLEPAATTAAATPVLPPAEPDAVAAPDPITPLTPVRLGRVTPPDPPVVDTSFAR